MISRGAAVHLANALPLESDHLIRLTARGNLKQQQQALQHKQRAKRLLKMWLLNIKLSCTATERPGHTDCQAAVMHLSSASVLPCVNSSKHPELLLLYRTKTVEKSESLRHHASNTWTSVGEKLSVRRQKSAHGKRSPGFKQTSAARLDAYCKGEGLAETLCCD